MIKYIVVLAFLSGWAIGLFLYTNVKANPVNPVNKEYDKGYQKGYADAEAKFAEGLAKRDSMDVVRHQQFISQMQRLAIAIERYSKATKNMQGL